MCLFVYYTGVFGVMALNGIAWESLLSTLIISTIEQDWKPMNIHSMWKNLNDMLFCV